MQSRARNRTRVPVLIVAVLCAVPLSAGKKSRPTYTYDQTGVISFASFADSSVTINTDSGSYSAYCTFHGQSCRLRRGGWGGLLYQAVQRRGISTRRCPVRPEQLSVRCGLLPDRKSTRLNS